MQYATKKQIKTVEAIWWLGKFCQQNTNISWMYILKESNS